MSLLIFENIYKEYKNQCVLNDVSLRVERGERLALIGPNGAGKTTLLKIAMGLEDCDRGNVIKARNIKIGYLSQDLREIENCQKGIETAVHYEKVYRLERKLRELEAKLEYSSKEAGSDYYKSLMDEYSRLLTNYEAIDGYTIEIKIKKILIGLGLRQETLETPLDKLSGGEKMRVSVARILLEEPDLLILDEPTNHLDIKATEWFESFLKKFEGGIIFVSHDRYFLDRVATRIAELENGSICTKSGNYSSYMQHKEQLIESVSGEQRRLKWLLKNANETVQGLKSRGKIKALKSREKEIEKLNEKLKIKINTTKNIEHLNKIGGPTIKFKKLRHVSKDIAWAENLSKGFGNITLFSNVAFHIRGGERIGIIGSNGCGKSTLINMILGNDKEYEGFLRLGEWVKYSYMGQQILFDNDNATCLDIIMSKREMQPQEARDHLARFQFFGEDVDKIIKVLSGGERVRLYLSCVMLEDADCLILDEPTNHLDVPARDAVEAALRDFKGTIIAVTHDRFFLTHCIDRILEFDNGSINTYEGNYDFYKQVKYGIEEACEEKELKMDKPSYKNINKKNNEDKISKLEYERCQVEERIAIVEEKLKEMEGSFNELTSLESYKEYEKLQSQAQELYSIWDKLI